VKSGAAANVETGTTTLLARVEDGVGVLTFNSPEKRNALGDDFTPFLREMIRRFAVDDAVRCVLLTGAGSAFCSGGNVKAMGGHADDSGKYPPPALTRTTWTGLPDGSSDVNHGDQFTKQATLTGTIHEMAKPTLAALPGAAAGAGFSIALSCDIRLAAKSAFVTTAFRNVGLSGDYGASWLLPQLVGPAKAKQLFYTAQRVQSSEALDMGIFQEVYEDGDLHTEALALAKGIAAGPRHAINNFKLNINAAMTGISFHEGLNNEARSMARNSANAEAAADTKEAIHAFIQKRKPVFS
jgi:enoyl-CoA hydratase/carnithine racemase